MAGFTKLFSTIVTSTVWMEKDEVLRVWIALLSQADAAGNVEGSVPGFAHLCRMSIDQFQASIGRLETPDPYSRTPDNAGRRIETVAGGWRILNYMKYREARNEDARRKQNSEAQARWRDAHKVNSKHISQSKPSVIRSKPASAHADADAEAEAEAEAEDRNGDGQHEAAPASIPGFFKEVRESGAYPGIDIDREFAKMKLWCSTHKKQPTKRRFLSWLNRVELPINGSEPDEPEPRRTVQVFYQEDEDRMKADIAAGRMTL